ncbi:uncharacterized protein LOC114161176 [Xiphophorus couchianus]|uniref:uncharacterized protein LOC114161176 n=1 Tax=Xiphophorus couchianus TaxID=32473 RepID=UPI001015F75D|nr:uncharacterized protein LOC114161176 [Xiphophorus couchianus]XP_027900125.1 uncharacterized protein LOC114161176 [Xiphophorus couchianus]XP_027900126.1 uncharacterized protein LOC114161176 [Xiphophorus couchianus]
MFLHSPLHCQPSTVSVLTDNILTNDQICEWIASMVSEFRYAREQGVFTSRTSEQHDSETSTSPPTLVVTSAFISDKDDEHKQNSSLTFSQLGSVTVGQSPEEDGLRTTTKSSSEKKEHSQILSEVSSTHEKKDEQSSVINTTIDDFSSDELTKESDQTVPGNSSDKDSMFRLDGSKTLDDKDGKSEVCQQQKGYEIKEWRVVAASRSSTTKEESRKAGKTQTDGASSLGSHQQNSTNVLDKRLQQTKPNHPAQSNTDGIPNFPILTDPQYDNISDVEEPLGLTARFLRVEQYEDISEDENQGSGKRAGNMGSTPPVVSEACSKTLGNVQIYDSPNTPTLDEITDVQSLHSVENADESEHHLCIDRDHGGQTSHFYEEFSDESDEESEVEFEVVPVMMSDLNPEPVEEEPASGKMMQHDSYHENQIHQHGISARQSCAPKPVPASAFSQMAIFDTPDDQEQAIRCGQVSFVALPCGSPESTSGQGEDSCATEDSCSYSSGPECNYMTVSKKLYKSISSAQRKTGHCVPDNREDVQMPPDDGIIDNLTLDAEDNHCESEMKKQSQTSENSKQNDESVVIILSDSDEEDREKYNIAKMASTATSVDCGRGSSRQERITATPEVATLDKNQKSSRSRVSWQQSGNEDLTREVISAEAEDSDDFSNAGVNVLVPERKRQRTASSHPRRLSEADITKHFSIIDRMIVIESKSGEPARLVRVPRDPRQGLRQSMPMAKSSFTERDRIREQPDKPASIPTRTHVEAHKNSRRRIMHTSQSPSSDNPSAMDHPFTPARFPSSSAPVQSMPVTSHARGKVFRTWKDQHVPLRREKKHKRANSFQRPR